MTKEGDVNLRKPNILKLMTQTYKIDLNWQKATLICELRHLICECTVQMENNGFEPMTSAVRSQRSTN